MHFPSSLHNWLSGYPHEFSLSVLLHVVISPANVPKQSSQVVASDILGTIRRYVPFVHSFALPFLGPSLIFYLFLSMDRQHYSPAFCHFTLQFVCSLRSDKQGWCGQQSSSGNSTFFVPGIYIFIISTISYPLSCDAFHATGTGQRCIVKLHTFGPLLRFLRRDSEDG